MIKVKRKMDERKAPTVLVFQPQIEERVVNVWKRNEELTSMFLGTYKERFKRSRFGEKKSFGHSPKRQLVGLIIKGHKCAWTGGVCKRVIFTNFSKCHAHLLSDHHVQARRTSLVERSGSNGLFAFDPTKQLNEAIFNIGDVIIEITTNFLPTSSITSGHDLWSYKLSAALSTFGASTNPNAGWTRSGNTLKVFATKEIKNNEEIILPHGESFVEGDFRLYWRSVRVRESTAHNY